MGYPTCLGGYLDPYAYPVWGVPAIAGTESELLQHGECSLLSVD